MAKLQTIKAADESITEAAFWCPGCEYVHVIRAAGPKAWNWNGSLDRPTFTPSYLVARGTDHACHSFITDGNIQFLNDCHHKLAGQTVEIPDWPVWPE
jgi:hypothetical protein